jgi:subtilase family serine protease
MIMLSQVFRTLRLSDSRSASLNFRSLAVAGMLLCSGALSAQAVSSSSSSFHAPPDRLTQPIQESSRVALPGTLHPLANKANDRGAVADGTKLDRIQVVLKRSGAQESALKQLIGEMHSPGSANYHKWLTPDSFGKQFGPSDADVATLESWLGSHGFSITKLNPGRQTLEIAGTAGQFRDTFHAQIHSYQVKGVQGGVETHFANASAPDIPAALAPVFGGFASLNNFRLKSNAHVLGKAQFNTATHEAKPEWTYSGFGSTNYVLAPGDFDVQYDLNPLYTAGTNGTGQSIAIVNESNINIAQVNNYRTLFGLPANPPQVIIDGNDPGIDGINSPYGPNFASGEAYLDVELAGAVAPDAQINLVIANDTALESGLTLAMERAVYSNISPIISLSFGGCEADQGSFNSFVNGLWEQAAAQGITVMVSTGDSGSAGCDNDNTQNFAVFGQAVNGLGSTPYNVAVGGTDFYYSQYAGTTAAQSAQLATYWNATPTNSTPTVSLLSKIPEQPWNNSQFGLNLYSYYASSGNTATSIAAGSGGASTCGEPTLDSAGNTTACAPYPKPSWQSGTGVPADSARDLPDVSLFAANGFNNSYYPICASDGDCEGGSTVQISGIGGTSAASPAFAGIMALVNQKYGRQGQANYVLYPLATQFPSAFNDVTVGTNTVPCATTTVYTVNSSGNTTGTYPSVNCMAVSNPLSVTDNTYVTANGVAEIEGEISANGTTASYNAGTGYDLATGLGTIDANNLVTNWGNVTLGATTTTMTPSSTTFAHGTAITVSGTVTGTSPTGNVSLLTTSADPNNQVEANFALSGGAYSGSVNYLPGGTYNISGYYPGDGSNAASKSTPVQITVTPEASTTALTVYTTALATTPGTLASGGSVSYGALTALSAKETGVSSGTSSGNPTGNVTFLDGGAVLNTAVVNAEGDAELNNVFAIGSHSITANYSGDGSYTASSTASPTTFTVGANTPNIYVSYTNGDVASGQTTYVAVQVENSSNYANSQALPPTGTVTVSGAPAGVPTTATLVPSVDPNGNEPEGTTYFAIPASQTGTLNLTFTYTPNTANYAATSYSQPITFASGIGSIATTTTASTSSATTSPTSAVQVTATVSATGSVAPTGIVALYSSEEIVGYANLPTVSGNSATVTISVPSGSLFAGTNQITVQYYPATNSNFSNSATEVTIANPLSDFSLVPVTTIVNVPGTTGVQTDVIDLNSYSGFSGSVSLACSGSGGVTCSLSSSSLVLASGGNASTTLTVNTNAVTKAGTYSVLVTGTDSTGNYIHTIGLQVVTAVIAASTTPGFTLSANPTSVSISSAGGSGTSTITATPTNSFTGTVTLTCAITGPAITGAPTCSAASESITGTTAATATLTFNTVSTTAAGTYTATVTGTSGSVTATTPVTVIVVGTAAGTFSLSNSAAITVTSQGGTGSSTISVVPGTSNPYAGSVALTCAVTASPTGATDAPTCSLSNTSVTLAGATLTSTLTISTTAQTTAKLHVPLKSLFTAGGGFALAALLFFGVPVRRRGRNSLRSVRTLRILSVATMARFMRWPAV